jgi:hypothetical protein
VITGMTLDWTGLVQRAPGSDNWPLTWAGDDHQYTSFGDGGGFGGTNDSGRTSLGIARIEGHHHSFLPRNLWGGAEAPHPATFDGKSYGILALDGKLYLWFGPGSGVESYAESRLAVSDDHGATWRRMDWAFPESSGLAMPTFLQYGQAHDAAPDRWVYAYFIRRMDRGKKLAVHRPGLIDLARAPRDSLTVREAWRFFAGAAPADTVWTADPAKRRPVFEDPAGVGWCASAGFLPGPGRIVLCTEHGTSFAGDLGIFEAEHPWGPWSTVVYTEGWGVPHVPAKTFFWNFAPKWSQGEQFVLVFTGIEELDGWNSVPGRFELAGS